jgi:Fe-S-cluster containining protein
MDKKSSIQFNREIAYLGEIGHRREEFCERYLKFKQRFIDAINTEQEEFASKQGQTISCHKGCAFCCGQLIQASLGECELIVFYLYHNEDVLNSFVRAFPSWLERAQKHPVLNKIEEAQRNRLAGKMSNDSMEQLGMELRSYWELQITCPFLMDNICSIYEVRPWACTSVISVSPSEWCNPVLKKEAKTFCLQMTPVIHLPFYDKDASVNLPDRNVPETVYKILVDGLRFFSDVPGLECLYHEFMNDNEIASAVRNINK